MKMTIDPSSSHRSITQESIEIDSSPVLVTNFRHGSDHAHQHKRPHDDEPTNSVTDNDEDATNHLARSLKRVRVSCTSSPGELCLQRDLKYLVDGQGWRLTRDGSFCYQNCLLRQGMCPSELILLVEDVGAQVHIVIPNAYPHRPPKIMPIDYRPVLRGPQGTQARAVLQQQRIESIAITDELQAGIWASQERSCGEQSASTMVLANWTPIRRLGDCLVDIIRILRTPQSLHTRPSTDWIKSDYASSLYPREQNFLLDQP